MAIRAAWVESASSPHRPTTYRAAEEGKNRTFNSVWSDSCLVVELLTDVAWQRREEREREGGKGE